MTICNTMMVARQAGCRPTYIDLPHVENANVAGFDWTFDRKTIANEFSAGAWTRRTSPHWLPIMLSQAGIHFFEEMRDPALGEPMRR